MNLTKIYRISLAHANAMYTIALAEHYRQLKAWAKKQNKGRGK